MFALRVLGVHGEGCWWLPDYCVFGHFLTGFDGPTTPPLHHPSPTVSANIWENMDSDVLKRLFDVCHDNFGFRSLLGPFKIMPYFFKKIQFFIYSHPSECTPTTQSANIWENIVWDVPYEFFYVCRANFEFNPKLGQFIKMTIF